jgi:hypothetical protein
VFSVPKPEKHAFLPSRIEKACFFPIESMLFVGGVGIGGPKACFIRQIGLRPAIFGALGRLPPVFVYTIIIATLPVFDNPNSNTSPGESIQVVKN